MARPAVRLVFHDDPQAFLDVAAAHLAADPVLNTVIASVTAHEIAHPSTGDHPRWWLTVHDGPTLVGVAMRTAPFAPHPLFVLPMPQDAAREVARVLVERGEDVGGVNGALPAAELLATEVARRTGRHARVHEHTRLHQLDRLVEPAAPPPGRARLAVAADEELATAWFQAFHDDAAEQAGRPPDGRAAMFGAREVRTRVDDALVWLWEDEHGRPVSLVGHKAPSLGAAGIGPVYTPGEQRGRGYASVLTAHVSRLLRDSGARVCLFTDQANPVSNRIYAAIGYVPVVDMANLVLDGRGGRAATVSRAAP